MGSEIMCVFVATLSIEFIIFQVCLPMFADVVGVHFVVNANHVVSIHYVVNFVYCVVTSVHYVVNFPYAGGAHYVSCIHSMLL
jgi:hypothetical protein